MRAPAIEPEVEALRWGDVDEEAQRGRVARQHEKGRRGRWASVPDDLFRAVTGRARWGLRAPPVSPWCCPGDNRLSILL